MKVTAAKKQTKNRVPTKKRGMTPLLMLIDGEAFFYLEFCVQCYCGMAEPHFPQSARQPKAIFRQKLQSWSLTHKHAAGDSLLQTRSQQHRNLCSVQVRGGGGCIRRRQGSHVFVYSTSTPVRLSSPNSLFTSSLVFIPTSVCLFLFFYQ